MNVVVTRIVLAANRMIKARCSERSNYCMKVSVVDTIELCKVSKLVLAVH